MKNSHPKPLSKSVLNQYFSRLTHGYLLALGLIGFLAFAPLAVLITQIHSQSRYAAMTALAVEQRALCQRIVLLALRLTQEPDASRRAEFRAIIARWVNDVERIQRGLIWGDPGLNLPGHPGRDIERLYQEAPTNLDDRIGRFCEEAHALLALPDTAPLAPQTPELTPLLQAIPGDLLGVMDRVLAAYEQAGSLRATHLQIFGTVLVTLLLLTLAGQMSLIFRPLIQLLFSETHALETNRRELDAVLRTVGKAILTTDERNVILTANRGAENIWKHPDHDLVGLSLRALVLPGSDLEQEDWRTMIPPGCRAETVGVRKGGGAFPLELCLTEVRHDTDDVPGGTRHFTVSARDIT